jgi:chitinase
MAPLRTLAALCLCVALAPAAASAQAPAFAPYADVQFSPDLAGWAKATGARQVILAFLNADDDLGCQPDWPVDEDALVAQVRALKAQGVDVIVSTGGWNANDLAARCPDAQSLAQAWQGALDRLAVSRLDVDAEAGDLHDNLDPTLVDRRAQALKRLQDAFAARGQRLEVTLTVPVSAERGLDSRALYVLQSAKAAGVRISVVDLMVMDFRDEPTPLSMGERSIAALQKVRGQLETVFPGRADRAYWAMLGATAMIGRNDAAEEVFGLDDAARLIAFARAKGMARLGFWSLSRDNGSCPGAAAASILCTGLAQDDGAFTRAFAKGLER